MRMVYAAKSTASGGQAVVSDNFRLVTTTPGDAELSEVIEIEALQTYFPFSGYLECPEAFAGIVTQNQKMLQVFHYLEAISRTPLPVLITGETGVGKELIARAIHALSGRRGQLVSINVAGVDSNLFTDTMFGHLRGGFTGAERERFGLVEQASGGTLFLDEIGDLGADSQVKLLRLLQEGTYYPIGSDKAKSTDARIIVATNQTLDLMQQNGRFRKDLYYRLYAHHVHVPPLRDRRDDLPLLIEHFLQRAAITLGKKGPALTPELLGMFENLHFAGNIRELEGIVFDLVSRNEFGRASIASIRNFPVLQGTSPISNDCEAQPEVASVDRKILFTNELPTLKQAEQLVIEEALKRAGGIQTRAAQILGISRRALNNRLRRNRYC
jgi:DNA-binding NtrC family response regulator